MAKEQLEAVRQLIKAGEHDAARKLLKKINHPTAREWEAKLNKIAPAKRSGGLIVLMRLLSVVFVVGGGLTVLAIVVAMLNKAPAAQQPAVPLVLGVAAIVVGLALRKYS